MLSLKVFNISRFPKLVLKFVCDRKIKAVLNWKMFLRTNLGLMLWPVMYQLLLYLKYVCVCK